jgi:hypothetical protein
LTDAHTDNCLGQVPAAFRLLAEAPLVMPDGMRPGSK